MEKKSLHFLRKILYVFLILLLFLLGLISKLLVAVVDPLFYSEMLIAKRKYKMIPRYFFTAYIAFFLSRLLTSQITVESVDSVRYTLSALIQGETTLMAVCISIGIILPQIFANSSRITDFNLDYRDYDMTIVATFFGVSIAITAMLLFSLNDATNQTVLDETAKWSFMLFALSLSSLFPFVQSEISKATITGQFSIFLGQIQRDTILESRQETILNKSERTMLMRFMETVLECKDIIVIRRICYLLLKKCNSCIIKARKKNHESNLSDQLLADMRKLQRQSWKSGDIFQTELLDATNILIDVIQFGSLSKDRLFRAFVARNIYYGTNLVNNSLEMAKHVKIDLTMLAISLLECFKSFLSEKSLISPNKEQLDRLLPLMEKIISTGNNAYLKRVFKIGRKFADNKERTKIRESLYCAVFDNLFAVYDLYCDKGITDLSLFNKVLSSTLSGCLFWETETTRTCFASRFIDYQNKTRESDRAKKLYDNLLSISKDPDFDSAMMRIILEDINKLVEITERLGNK